MSKILTKKSAALALALATLGSAALVTGAEARPRHYWGYGAAAVAGASFWGPSLPLPRRAASRFMSRKTKPPAVAALWNA